MRLWQGRSATRRGRPGLLVAAGVLALCALPIGYLARSQERSASGDYSDSAVYSAFKALPGERGSGIAGMCPPTYQRLTTLLPASPSALVPSNEPVRAAACRYSRASKTDLKLESVLAFEQDAALLASTLNDLLPVGSQPLRTTCVKRPHDTVLLTFEIEGQPDRTVVRLDLSCHTADSGTSIRAFTDDDVFGLLVDLAG